MRYPKLKVTLQDVVEHGSVEEAIHAACTESRNYASGVYGPSFESSEATETRHGWTRQFGVMDYARRALEDGLLGYVDTEDGLVAVVCEDEEECEDEVSVGWRDDILELVPPSEDEALENVDAAREMMDWLANSDLESAPYWTRIGHVLESAE